MDEAGGAFHVVVSCDNCGKPGTVNPAWAQLEMTQFDGPEVTARAALCPVCAVTVEAMLFTRWNGRHHSHRFLVAAQRGLDVVDDDESDDELLEDLPVEVPPAAEEGDDDGDDGWREPTEEELWSLWKAHEDGDPDEP